MAEEADLELEIGDAFGAALLECLQRGVPQNEVFDIIERDDGYIDAADVAPYFATPAGAQADWVRSRVLGSVLDIGAGAGRWALDLQELGFDVMALDVSPGAIEVCRRRGIRKTFIGPVENLISSQQSTSFDTFLLMGNNLGLLANKDSAPRFLDALARLSSPSSRILAEGLDAIQTTNPDHLAYHDWNRRRGRLPGQASIRVRHRRLVTPWFDYLMPSLMELDELLAGSAWRRTETLSVSAKYFVALERVER